MRWKSLKGTLCVSILFGIEGCFAGQLPDPTSKQAQELEERFLLNVEKHLHEKNRHPGCGACESNAKKVVSHPPVTIQPSLQPQPRTSLNTIKPIPIAAATTATPRQTVPVCQKNVEVQAKPQKSPKKEPFTGFYCALGGGLDCLYTKAAIDSYARPSLGSRMKDTIRADVYYGSYEYNNDTWLTHAQAFVGYDWALTKWIRLGIEIEGGLGWRSHEINSCGVYGYKYEGKTDRTMNFDASPAWSKDGLTRTNVGDGEEVDFAYMRATMKAPYHWSLLPKVGIPLSSFAIFYTKFGFLYENFRITDHPESIDIQVQNYSKKTADEVYNDSKFSWMGSIGLEAKLSDSWFLRMECSCSSGPQIALNKQNAFPQVEKEDKEADNRQTENLKITSIKKFSLGLGAGFRF